MHQYCNNVIPKEGANSRMGRGVWADDLTNRREKELDAKGHKCFQNQSCIQVNYENWEPLWKKYY